MGHIATRLTTVAWMRLKGLRLHCTGHLCGLSHHGVTLSMCQGPSSQPIDYLPCPALPVLPCIYPHRFASTYHGKYSVAVPDAAAFYPSSNWMDDVAFNALWLYMRTGDAQYKAEGLAWYMKHYNQEEGKGVWNNFDWDSNSWGAALLVTRCGRQDRSCLRLVDMFGR